MLRFGATKTPKEKFQAAEKLVDIGNVIDKVTRQLVFKLSKNNGYVKTFKLKGENNKLMSFRINNEKLIEKYKVIWTKIEDLKNIELNVLPVYDDRYIKTKIGTYGDKVYINFHGLNVPEVYIECQSSFLLTLYFDTKINVTCKYI